MSVFMSSHFIVSMPHALLKGCWFELSTHTSGMSGFKMSVVMSSKWVCSCHQNECIHVISFHCIYAIHVIKMIVFKTLILDPLHALILNTLIPEVWVDNLMDTLIHVIERSVFMSSHFIVSMPNTEHNSVFSSNIHSTPQSKWVYSCHQNECIHVIKMSVFMSSKWVYSSRRM